MRTKKSSSAKKPLSNSPVFFTAYSAPQLQEMLTLAAAQGAEQALVRRQIQPISGVPTVNPKRTTVRRGRTAVARKPQATTRKAKAAKAVQKAPKVSPAKAAKVVSRKMASSDDTAKVGVLIVGAVTDSTQGLAKREIVKQLSLDPSLVDKALRVLVKQNTLRIQGKKRAAKYVASGKSAESNGVSVQA